MTICDRCESRDGVRVMSIRADFGPDPIKPNESQFWTRELCEGCRKSVDRAITAALESAPKQARSEPMNDRNWTRTDREFPPRGVVVEAMDSAGRVQDLELHDGGLWFVPDGSMYVYFTPTYWRLKPKGT